MVVTRVSVTAHADDVHQLNLLLEAYKRLLPDSPRPGLLSPQSLSPAACSKCGMCVHFACAMIAYICGPGRGVRASAGAQPD
jgi:hypothetical protein